VEILTIETTSLGDRSYVVTDGEVAAVIDPQRDIDRVLDLLADHGARLTDVFETHLHNDYVTGGLELSRRTGATYHVAADDDVSFDRAPIRDGDEVAFGRALVRAIHTPGHTPTHLSYVLVEDGRDLAVFTGGSMLFGSVGRTDLISAEATEELTRAQYHSVRKLAALDDDAQVRPTHGFGSFCSSGETAEQDTSTIAAQRADNQALTIDDEDEFLSTLLAGLDAYPAYYAHMAPRNAAGPAPVDLSPVEPVDPAELKRRLHAGEWVVDLRTRTAFAADHLRRSINIELDDQLSTYLGWLVPWSDPDRIPAVTMIGDAADQVAQAQRQLARIGIDRPAGAFTDDLDRVGRDGDRGSYPAADFAEVAAMAADADDLTILDVRQDGEWAAGHIASAMHIPLHELDARIDEVPSGRVAVHCASGYRSSIAASLLARAGRSPVLIDDEYPNAGDHFPLA
jgi:glyoxylase-like metal-dependent hydrolase (beta-lactamase superfamily II)